jgi:hypothetical protein
MVEGLLLGIVITLLALWLLPLLVRKLFNRTDAEQGTETKEMAAIVAAISTVVPPERIKSIDIKRA